MINNMQKSGNKAKLVTTLYLVVALFLVPAYGLYQGLLYFSDNQREIENKKASQKLSSIKTLLAIHSDQKKFWVNRLSALFTTAKKPEDFARQLSTFNNDFECQIDYIVFANNGKRLADNFLAGEKKQNNWNNLGAKFLEIFATTSGKQRITKLNGLRKALGFNFFIPGKFNSNEFVADDLYPSDFARNEYYYWLARKAAYFVLVRIPAGELSETTGLKYFQKNHMQSKLSMALVKDDSLVASDFLPTEAKLAQTKLLENIEQEFVQINNHLFSTLQIRPRQKIILRYQLSEVAIKAGKLSLLILLLSVFTIIMLLQTGIISDRVQDLSLLAQLFILMGVSAGIPLLVLCFLALGYFNNKQTALIREKNLSMIEFVQHINENLQTEIARTNHTLNRTIEANKDFFRTDYKPQNASDIIKNGIGGNFLAVYLIKENEIITFNGAHKNFKFKVLTSQTRDEQGKVEFKNIGLIANHHQAFLNDQPAKKVDLENSYIFEMFFQKPIEMFVHDLIKWEGGLANAAWGNDRLLLFVKAYRLFSRKFYDFYVIASYVHSNLQRAYIARQLNNILRNPWGYKVLIADDNTLFNTQQSLLKLPEINSLFMKVADYPPSEPQILDFSGEQHLFVGLKGNKAEELNFCLLFPLARINQEIRQEAFNLAYFALIALAIVFFMVVILYLNLLQPVKQLQKAVAALENRDSAFRLPERGSDEFALMARIFNRSIEEFEELEIASIVQNKLFPSAPLSPAGFSLYGKSLPMAFLGGDYFDYFAIDQDHFVFLLGDVAGHGIGASLIMAMAKAGVICADAVKTDPKKILGRLHQIVLGIKNRAQRKVMTFQYMLVKRRENEMIYANAGGCSPVIIDSQAQSIEVLKYPGAVLGGFKKSVFKNRELNIKAGQAVIFYTDGMVESRNKTGHELGYQGLYEIFLSSYNADAEIYYNNIYETYANWLGDVEAGDDLTVIIMVCNKQPD
jgi:serine phosphatase RsbU (regulator of sigma subunit)